MHKNYVVAVVVGVLFGVLINRYVKISKQYGNVETISQFKTDLRDKYYNTENVESVLKNVLENEYTGDFDIDFNNYVIATVINDININEDGDKAPHNLFVGKIMSFSVNNYYDGLSGKNYYEEYDWGVYVKIANFDKPFYNKLKNFFSEGDIGNKSLVIDLRTNYGGGVEVMSEYADLFLQKGQIITTLQKKSEKHVFVAKNNEQVLCTHIDIIVDASTASSAEIFTLALRENLENVTVVGEKTFGKGFGDIERKLKDGSRYYLVAFDSISPLNNNITGAGIRPDAEIDTNLELPDILKRVTE